MQTILHRFITSVKACSSGKLHTSVSSFTKIPEGLRSFFDHEDNLGKRELRPRRRPGRSWSVDELRLKSNSDLHKLWYVLLKERNMLFTMFEAYASTARYFPNAERIDRVAESMKNLESVVHERNDAYFKLETGQSADRPSRTVTSFAGFTYRKPSTEHYLPAELTKDKEYELPYLDDDAYLMQKLWNEKDRAKSSVEAGEKWRKRNVTINMLRFKRSARRTMDRLEHFE